MKTDTSDYFATIDKCAKDGINLNISNGNATHAAYLIKTIFLTAKESVCIFTGELYSGVFDNPDLISAAKGFLSNNKNGIVEIVFDGSSDEEILGRNFVKEIFKEKDAQRRIDIRSFDKNMLGDENKIFWHFTVMDGKAYRLETDHNLKRAKANFGDSKTAESLRGLFTAIKEISVPVNFASCNV